MHDSKTPPAEQASGGKPFGMVQADIFRDRTLPSAVKLVYVALATYADTQRSSFPSQQTIAHDTGLSVRSVGKAVRQGVEAGLFAVIHTQTSNRYQLRDMKVGGYALGSGPEIRVGTTCRPGTQDVPSGTAPGADKQDQTSRPASQTRTSSDAFAASGHRASAPTDITIFLPRDFMRWDDDGRVHQYLVSASLSALKAAGMEPAEDAADRIGRALRATTEDGMDRAKLVDLLRGTLNLADTDNKSWGSLARSTSRAS